MAVIDYRPVHSEVHAGRGGNASPSSASGGKEALRLENLSFAYRDETLIPGIPFFQNLELQIHRGDAYALLGAEGAGKTTLLRLLLGQLTPAVGRISVLGRDPRRDSLSVRSRLAYLPQENDLEPGLTAETNLSWIATAYGKRWNPDLAEGSLRQMGVWEERGRRVARISRGARQRLALAAALAVEPELLLLDASMSGLEDWERKLMLASILDYRQRVPHGTLILTARTWPEVRDPVRQGLIDHLALLTLDTVFYRRLLLDASLAEMAAKLLVAEVPRANMPLILEHHPLLLIEGEAPYFRWVYWVDEAAERESLNARILACGGQVVAPQELETLLPAVGVELELAEVLERFTAESGARQQRSGRPVSGRMVLNGRLMQGGQPVASWEERRKIEEMLTNPDDSEISAFEHSAIFSGEGGRDG